MFHTAYVFINEKKSHKSRQLNLTGDGN